MSTQKRRSHNKSRKGCFNCKKRHVKCDEQGPPCAACVARDTTDTCRYEQTPARSPPSPSKQHLSPTHSPSGSFVESLPLDHAECEFRRLLELDLMLHWSTHTWKSFSGVPEDHHYLQVDLPRAGLQHPYLHDSIMSATAIDRALNFPHSNQNELDKYTHAAMEYYDKASAALRTALADMTPENQHCLYMCSSNLIFTNLTMPRLARMGRVRNWNTSLETNMLVQMGALFDLFIGTGLIMALKPEWLNNSPVAGTVEATRVLMIKAGSSLRDPNTQLAFDRLMEITLRHNTSFEGSLSPTLQNSYNQALALLRLCFVMEDAAEPCRGFCFGFPMFVDAEFALAFRRNEPLALLFMMHWAVMVHILSSQYWWAVGVGDNLIDAISNELLRKDGGLELPLDWIEAIWWARGKVGLENVDALAGLSLDGVDPVLL